MALNCHTAILASALSVLWLAADPTAGALVQQQPLVLMYHNGKLLKGKITVNLVWYGTFTPIQRSIIVDFIKSPSAPQPPLPSAATWWKTTEKYKAGSSALVVGKQILLESYSLGKFLKARHLLTLASKFNDLDSITVVLTAKDVAVDGFCVSRCGTHWSTQSVDKTTGASYNAHGVKGRKFLLPAMWDPHTLAGRHLLQTTPSRPTSPTTTRGQCCSSSW